ncbi:TIGR04255 family protein [Rhizobium sp. S153]|uniref:TIGR04255 family protein n=1 Tax=Ciceribacter sichuanensis TaxID=2949647 RepID=A0ABT0V1L8_9HYPH|nr:TIGR04255 family protein [Ciceribacter sp. S153]MCM2399779.1 TIGR04255 family protein [Ciceribacter sp. S153]
MAKLPISLRDEPLIDAIFELRFEGQQQLADILPGVLFSAYHGAPKISRLPFAEIPQPVRASDPNLVFVPTIRLDLDGFAISIGARNVVVSSAQPYPKWAAFREFILGVCERVANSGLELELERFSLKYVNLLQGGSVADQVNQIRMQMAVGDLDYKNGLFSLQLQVTEDDFLHIVSVMTGAVATLPNGTTLAGTILDVDSVCHTPSLSFREFFNTSVDRLERLRHANKSKFFSSLTEEAIQSMGPNYG